jgi:hypothetical protein
LAATVWLLHNRDMSESLADELLRALEERLQTAGWARHDRIARLRPRAAAAGHLASFSRQAGDVFAVTAIFAWMNDDESSPLVVAGRIGLEYAPAGPWLTALTDPEIYGVLLLEPLFGVDVATTADVDAAVEGLVACVSESCHNAAGLSDLDPLIELLRTGQAIPLTRWATSAIALDYVEDAASEDVEADSDEHEEYPAEAKAKLASAELMAVLLVLADHADEARGVLSDYRPPDDEPQLAAQHARFVGHFRRFLDGESGQPPTTPARWPPAPVGPEGTQGFAERMTELAPKVRAQHEAVQAVRAVSEGKTREELRDLLERELDERGVPMDPSSLEIKVDALATERETFGKARIALKGLKALGELISEPSLGEVFTEQSAHSESESHEHGGPLDEPPEIAAEFDLPERAAYPIDGSLQRRASVALDPDALSYLERLASESSLGHGWHVAIVNVWLSGESSPSTTGAPVDVHIGTRLVGRLLPDHADLFRGAMHAAADRDENAWTRASLTECSGAMPYQLEVMLPIGSAYPDRKR